MQANHQTARRTLALGQTALLLAAMLSQAFAGSALAAGITSATFTGGTGTASVGGTLYSRSGAPLTLTVVTDEDTNCVALTGAHTGSTTTISGSTTTSKTWTFSLSAAPGADGARTTTISASDDSGCTGSGASVSRGYVIDNTGPTVSATRTPQPNAFGWNNSDISITWTASDSGSGVASGPTPATDSQTTDTGSLSKTSSATDAVGNTRSGMIVVKLDKTAPTISGSRSPAANGNGWNNTNVTVSFTCSDGRSGIRLCSSPTTLSSNGTGQSVTGGATDFASNTSSTTVIVNIDKNAPTISGTPVGSPNGAGWYNRDVTVAWTCVDTGGSGFAAGACADSAISGEGTGLTLSKLVTDLAGNASSLATSSPSVNVDKTAPVTSASAVGAWNNVDLTIVLTPSDGLSGVASTQFIVDGGSEQTYGAGNTPSFTVDGVHSLEFWSVDNAGNVETHHSIAVNIDKTQPSISASQSPAANSSGWNNTDVTVSFSCSDPTSGIASCTADQTISTEGAAQPVSGTALDNAGNSATASAYVSIDKTAPVVSVTGVTSGATYQSGAYGASCSSTDALSGIASPATLSTSSGASGSVTLTCSGALDRAGNPQAAPVSVTILVAVPQPLFTFGGFMRPVAGNGTLNSAKAGSAIPVRFSLGGYQGMDIFAVGYPTSVSYACSSTPPSEASQATVTAGGSGLGYDATSSTYSYVWKTDKSWTGCRMLQLKFSDGSSQRAYFSFR